MKVKFKSLLRVDKFVAVLLVLFVQIWAARCDLYIFSKDKDVMELGKQRQKNDINYRPAFDPNRGLDGSDDKLYLFPNSKSCMDQIDFDVYFKNNDRTRFCGQYCGKDYEAPFRSTTAGPYVVEYTTMASSGDFGAESEDGAGRKEQLSAAGLLHYYRGFIHVFLEKLKHEETNEENPNFKVNIELSRLQIAKLQRFSESVNDTDASGLIQETTYILKNMLQGVDHFRPETVMDNVKKVFSFNLAQYAFLILATVTSFIVMILHHFGFKRFTWKNLIITLVFVAFASSVFNNHIILNQKKQILRQQKLKEIIPDECFLNSNEQQQQQKSQGFSKAVFQVLKKYMGHSPTSRSCLEYQEALFINSYQSNIAETIMYTFFESIRPVAISFGDFINQFHVALVKDLSFYQAIPLLILVTIILVPVILYLMSFLFLVLFNYEFNFFHLISFKKSAKTDKQQLNEIKAALMNQKKEMIKALRMIRQENAKIGNKHEAVAPESLASLTYSTAAELKDKSALSPLKPPSGAQVYNEIPKLNTSEYDDDADDDEDGAEGGEMNLTSNVSAMLDRTLESLFENINSKENEYAEQISQLLEENKRLKGAASQRMILGKQQQNLPFPLPPQQFKSFNNDTPASASSNSRPSSHSPPKSAQKGSSASPAPRAKPVAPNQSPQTPSKIISIGPSKTVRPLLNEAPVDNKQHGRVRKTESLLTDSIESSTERIFRQGDQNDSVNEENRVMVERKSSPDPSYRTNQDADDDDEDEDIYVILEDK